MQSASYVEDTGPPPWFAILLVLVMLMCLLVVLVALVLGVAGMLQRRRKKRYAVLGALISVLVLGGRLLRLVGAILIITRVRSAFNLVWHHGGAKETLTEHSHACA
jgi:asparagine N-glycosylation enzyme membrane subunit Stt3